MPTIESEIAALGQFDVIVVDPPWPMKKIARRLRPRQSGFDYDVMTLNEIAALPIGSLSHDKSWLFLWTTQKHLEPAFGILRSWGFNHLLTMTWEKTYGRSNGMALYGFRWNGEFILVGYRTKPKLCPKMSLIPVVFSAENVRHSQKPDCFYSMVEVLGERCVDIFARQQRPKWTVWGKEINVA